ncbi:hypothetical protein GYA19_03295 [Candidatus Beckwithbacteria bacterium]|nr:hypothetical protein [Candidatus Beckwithbacteria bacterium]
MNHSSFKKGTRIRVKLTNNTVFIDHFEDKKSGTVFLREKGILKTKNIKSLSIYKK